MVLCFLFFLRSFVPSRCSLAEFGYWVVGGWTEGPFIVTHFRRAWGQSDPCGSHHRCIVREFLQRLEDFDKKPDATEKE